MLDEIGKLYSLMRKHLPQLADHADALVGAEKEKFVKGVEPYIKQFVENRTKNVTDIKSSFAERVNSVHSVPEPPAMKKYRYRYSPIEPLEPMPRLTPRSRPLNEPSRPLNRYEWLIVGVAGIVGGELLYRWVFGKK
ncbi:MAG: hypothetical protein NUV76_09005 [Candidatus Kuenenia sp.]|nr:hypothetical protein [Candidatus Kuenenia sp.]